MRKLVEQPFWLDPADPHRMPADRSGAATRETRCDSRKRGRRRERRRRRDPQNGNLTL
jgi:hypothetical protein